MSDFLETTGICVFIVIGIALGYYTLLGLGYNRQLGLCESANNVHQCELVAVPKEVVDE
mgnify:CR=1 FL=1